MLKGAEISICKKYRYQLWRIWDDSKPKVLWVMHNPSTADADIDDPTIRRCIGFSQSWGYGGIYVGNLVAYRATNPKELIGIPLPRMNPIYNAASIVEMALKCQLHILAYGNPILKESVPESFNDEWHYLKLTKDGNPGHPLYLKSDLKPMCFNKRGGK